MHGALYLHYTQLLGPDRQQVRLDYWPVVILIPLNRTRNLTVVMERHTTFNEKLSLDSNVPRWQKETRYVNIPTTYR